MKDKIHIEDIIGKLPDGVVRFLKEQDDLCACARGEIPMASSGGAIFGSGIAMEILERMDEKLKEISYEK